MKYSKGCDGCDDLQEALSSILGILKAVNDSMHLIAITGYEVREKRMIVGDTPSSEQVVGLKSDAVCVCF